MKKTLGFLTLTLAIVITIAPLAPAWNYIENLAVDDDMEIIPNQVIYGFRLVNIYENGAGDAMGARLISDKYGFIIDLLQIQSVPQAFYWVKTPPSSSKGEPHACEHLLLGKGNRGRYVAALEDMALGNSSAYTAQIRTCYHFNTTAGEETFYEIFEAKLKALLHPDFTDEEIRREVCHIGVVVDPEDGSLSIDEKGTVYTEMVSGFEKPWYYFAGELNNMVYGENHPLSYISGGDPAVMRSMVPEDMWQFHKRTYHLSNMGAVVSVPDEVSSESLLERMNAILDRCQDHRDSSSTVGIGAFDFPPANMAPPGTLKLTTYPSDKEEDPGYVMFAWPADLELDYIELFVLDLFLETFAGGQTSNLYDLFINSRTRKIDLGGNYVFGGTDSDLGVSIYFGLVGIDNSHVNETMLDSIRVVVENEIQRVHDFADGSDELTKFNKRVESRLIQNRKQIDNYLNSPPMFGFRSGAGGGWLSLLESLEKQEGFRKSLVLKDRFNYAESLLTLDRNIWKEYIDHWRLLTVKPYAIGSSPSPEMLADAARKKAARLAEYIDGFKNKYGVTDNQKAIVRYKEEFDAKTTELDALAGKDELPGFIDNPPMTLDEQLKYETMTLPGGIPLVASTFDNMTSSNVGIALRLDVIPESLLVYVPYLPDVLTDIGVIKEGEVIPFEEMQERLRQEVLRLSAYFDHGFQSGRIELVLSGRGNNLGELKNALGWMDAALYAPYLSVDNLPRMLDLIDQSLISYRNMTKGSEEGWVRYPAYGYRFQDNPLFMSTNCFLTETHHYQRLRWLLTDPGDDHEQQKLASYINALAVSGKGKTREELAAFLTALENVEESLDETVPVDLKSELTDLSEASRNIATEITRALKITLADIPDANLSGDWDYLCEETKTDLMVKPEKALADISAVLDLIRRSDNARMFMISNSGDHQATLDMIGRFVGKLDSENPSVRQRYPEVDRVVQRLKSREPGIDKPVYVGLVYEGTRNGVLIFSAKSAGIYDTSSSVVLNCLTGKLYSGGGPHGLFMKTWAAGLAYSNGYRYGQANGRVSYYAERCPDVSETMRFVVNELKNAEDDPGLTDYAVAQVFGNSRAPSRYEQRGEAMASDLVDGITPEVVRTFREKVLEMKNRQDLYEELKSRMEETYGPVLIGYGPSLADSKEATFFLIGPPQQFESLEHHIESTEGRQTIHRLYPRDFWLTL